MAGQANTNRYKDLDLDFIAHPVTGDVVQKINKDSIKGALKNLILMTRFDKPFQPHIDSKIREMLFELPTPLIAIELRKTIFDTLTRYEPRIKVIEVDAIVNVRTASYNITLTYQIVNQPTVESVAFQLERLR